MKPTYDDVMKKVEAKALENEGKEILRIVYENGKPFVKPSECFDYTSMLSAIRAFNCAALVIVYDLAKQASADGNGAFAKSENIIGDAMDGVKAFYSMGISDGLKVIAHAMMKEQENEKNGN